MIIILGIGSPFADDQAGWLVARELLAQKNFQSKIRNKELIIEELDRPGINLLYWLELDHTQLFLIDMVKTNLAIPGRVHILRGKEIARFSGMLSSHSLGVASSIALAETLGIDISKVTFWGIEGIYSNNDNNINAIIFKAICNGRN